MKTLSQLDYEQAIMLVTEVHKQFPADGTKDQQQTRSVYGTLCHRFPVMVLTMKLAPTIAFCASKKDTGARGLGYTRLLDHVAAVLGCPVDGLQNRLANESTFAYLEDSRRVLDAWTPFKRLASSILKVEPGRDLDAPEQAGEADA